VNYILSSNEWNSHTPGRTMDDTHQFQNLISKHQNGS